MNLVKCYERSASAVTLLYNNMISEVELPFEVSAEERRLIDVSTTRFILGLSGTGKVIPWYHLLLIILTSQFFLDDDHNKPDF